MTLRVALVVPEGEIWAGSAEIVIAKTLDGDIGVMTDHAPVLGILSEGSVVQIRPENSSQPDVFAAVSGGFFSVAENRISILARHAQLGAQVDTVAAQAALDEALQAPDQDGPEDSADVRYFRALLRASGQAN